MNLFKNDSKDFSDFLPECIVFQAANTVYEKKKFLNKLFEVKNRPGLIPYMLCLAPKWFYLADTFRKWLSHGFKMNYGVFQTF